MLKPKQILTRIKRSKISATISEKKKTPAEIHTSISLTHLIIYFGCGFLGPDLPPLVEVLLVFSLNRMFSILLIAGNL
jgi:hypothetical protein